MALCKLHSDESEMVFELLVRSSLMGGPDLQESTASPLARHPPMIRYKLMDWFFQVANKPRKTNLIQYLCSGAGRDGGESQHGGNGDVERWKTSSASGIHGVTTVAYGQSIVLLAALKIQSRGFDLHREFCPHLKLGFFYPTAADSGIK